MSRLEAMMIRLSNEGMFGKVPSPPEIECDGVFEDDKCMFCSEYDNCKRESEDEGD